MKPIRRVRGVAPFRATGTALLLLGVAISWASEVRAQQGQEERPRRCRVEDSRLVRSIAAGEGRRITYVSEPRIRCVDGTRLEADSAVVFEATGLTQLLGNVFFDDRDTRLTADRANYFENQRRLRAWGRTVLTDRVNRSVIRGDTLVLLRAGPARALDELTVTGDRPHATLYPAGAAVPEVESPQRDTAGAPRAERPRRDTVEVPGETPGVDTAGAPGVEPYEVDADDFYFRGREYMLATGDVEVERGDSLRAFADTLAFMRDRDLLDLRGGARIRSPSYDIEGRTVSLFLPDDEIREVTAREDAVLIGEELRLDAEMIRIFLEAGAVERLVAAPDPERDGDVPLGEEAEPRRPRAVAEEFVLEADSLDVLAPGGELERLVAIGSARGEGTGRDSLDTPDTPDVLRSDWVEGDTVIALFSPVAPAETDTTADERQEYQLEELQARGSARSLYRLEPSDTAFVKGRDRPAASYVVGQSIRILLEEGSVAALEVEGLSRGVHLEPRRTEAAPGEADTSGTEGGGAAAEAARGTRRP